MARTSTSTPGMVQAAGYLTDVFCLVRNGVTAVDDALYGLKSTWTGDASAAFDSSMQAWMDDCYFIAGKLSEMINLMHANRKVITAGEEAHVAEANNIPAGPGLVGMETGRLVHASFTPMEEKRAGMFVEGPMAPVRKE